MAECSALPFPDAPLPTAPSPDPVNLDSTARLEAHGPQTLASTELLSVVLAFGRPGPPETHLKTAAAILSEPDAIKSLRNSSVPELAAIPAIGKTKARAILAAIELGARIATPKPEDRAKISSPNDVDATMRQRLAHLDREVFAVILLDTKNRVIATLNIAIGTLSKASVHPREVFKPAIKASADGIIAVHNHPSGAHHPSPEDREFTRRLSDAGETIGIELLDHVIIGDPGFTSLKELGYI